MEDGVLEGVFLEEDVSIEQNLIDEVLRDGRLSDGLWVEAFLYNKLFVDLSLNPVSSVSGSMNDACLEALGLENWFLSEERLGRDDEPLGEESSSDSSLDSGM